MIYHAKQKAVNMDQGELLRSKVTQLANQISCVIRYTHLVGIIESLIYYHWHLVHYIPACESPPYIGLKKIQALRNILLRSDTAMYPSKDQQESEQFKSKKCSVSDLVLEI